MSGPQSQSGSEQDHGERQPRPFSIQKTPVSIQAPSFPSHLQLHALQQQKQNHSTEPTTRLLAPERAHIHSHTHHTIARPFSYVPSIRERTSEEEEPPPPPPLPSMPPKDHSNHSMQSSDRGIDQPHFDYSYHNSMPVPPPLSQHPAQFAPLADETDPPPPQHPQAEAPTQYTYTNSQVPQQEPPASPGPLPPKLNPPIDNQTRPLSHIHIAPDDNPLLSRSPAPTYHSRAASRVGTQVGFGSTATANGTPDIFSHIPGQAVHPQQGMKGGTWTYGLCHPTDIATCCLGLFCPCILYGKTQYRLSRKSKRKDPTNMLGYEVCNASCTAMALLCGCQWLLSTIQHTRIRRAYGIPGGFMADCVRASCCMCCTLIQDEREIRTREEAARPGAGFPVTAPYSAPSHMNFSPPPRS